jgi:FAD:protein FMN transferase
MSAAEAVERFECFGCSCAVLVTGDTPAKSSAEAALNVREEMLGLHERFSRFLPASELSLLNADPRTRVPVSPLMARLAESARAAGSITGGLVDATLLGELQRAGYSGELERPLPLELALALAPARRPAEPATRGGWSLLEIDLGAPALTRPPGVQLDSGGIAKGLFADLLAESLTAHDSFAVDCGGDLAIGGGAGQARNIEVQSPFDGSVIHRFSSALTGVATSGIGRRSWLGRDGLPGHHLLDPASGRPAFTGVVQATALAPSALLGEIHAKAAVLSGPAGAARWLAWGGVVVLDDGSHTVIEPSSDASGLAAAA